MLVQALKTRTAIVFDEHSHEIQKHISEAKYFVGSFDSVKTDSRFKWQLVNQVLRRKVDKFELTAGLIKVNQNRYLVNE